MNNDRTRASLFGVIAAYFLYLCYGLFQGRNDTNTTMTPVVRWLFFGLFALAAAGIGFYAFRIWKQSEGDNPEEQDLSEELQEEEPEQTER